jgi:hypothetical protein
MGQNIIDIKIDVSQLEQMGTLMAAAGAKAPTILRYAVNHTGAKARTAMVRSLTQQTGLKQRVIKRALKAKPAMSSHGAEYFVIKTLGGNISIKYFGAREKGDGADAHPWNRRQHFKGAFTKAGGGFGAKGGRRGRKAIAKLHGHFIRREGASKYPTDFVKSGLFIPQEMVSGATREAFFAVAQSDLAPRIFHELLRVFPSK